MGIVQSRKHAKRSARHRPPPAVRALRTCSRAATTSNCIEQQKVHAQPLRVEPEGRGTKSTGSLPQGFRVGADTAMAEDRIEEGVTSPSPYEEDSMMNDAVAGPSEQPTFSSRRRRTRSMAQSVMGEDSQLEDTADSATGPRRIRRRTQEKRRAEEDSVSTHNSTTAHDTGSAFPMQGEIPAELVSSSAVLLGATPAPESGRNFRQNAATITTDDQSQSNHSAAAMTSGPSVQSSSTARTDDERRAQVRRQIAQAVGSGLPSNHVTATQDSRADDGARPSMLSALLSDILGLRGGPRPTNPTGSGVTEGTAAAPSQAQAGGTASRSEGSGGTSVIVQGALVSRTVASRNAASGNDIPGHDARQGRPSAFEEERGHSAASSHNSNVFDSASGPDSAMAGEPGDAQAATIEEQATMLVRLLSIATAATAASLLQAPASRPRAASQGASVTREAQAGRAESGNTASGILTSDAIASQHALEEGIGASTSSPTQSSNAVIAERPSSTPNTSNVNTSAWASHTLQSLRSRIASLGNRLRGRRTTIRSQWPQRLASAPSLINARGRSFGNPPIEAVNAQEDTQQTGAAPSLAALSNMLRDAIRDGLQGSGGGGGDGDDGADHHHDTTRPPRAQQDDATASASSSSASLPAESANARSRIQSVNATLEAVRGGQLTRGEEGSFNRFLFDLASDLNIAVRGLPGNESGDDHSAQASSDVAPSIEAHARRQGDTHNGQLSFFRFFSFPSGQTANVNGAEGSSSLLPCIVVGVRSLGSNDAATADVASAAEAATNDQADGVAARDRQSTTEATSPTARATASQREPPQGAASASRNGGSGGATFAPESLLYDGSDAPNMSRFLLFVSGGHYPPQHPLFHASNEESSRDLMVLMEFLGAMAAVQAKPNNTVTRDEIARSSLRAVNGARTEVETLTRLQQVMENTSERCLICLEDWKDEPEERRLLDCGHLFHAPCLDQWLVSSNNSCPLCRRQAVAPTTADATTATNRAAPPF